MGNFLSLLGNTASLGAQAKTAQLQGQLTNANLQRQTAQEDAQRQQQQADRDLMTQLRQAQIQAEQALAEQRRRVKGPSPNARLVRDDSGEYVWVEPPPPTTTAPTKTGVKGYTPPKTPTTPRGATGPTPEDQTRKDLKDFQSQQIRAEHQLTGLKSERRALVSDHPRAARPLSDQRTAADSTFAKQYQGLGPQIDSAQARLNRLTTSADSTLGVLNQMRRRPQGQKPGVPLAPPADTLRAALAQAAADTVSAARPTPQEPAPDRPSLIPVAPVQWDTTPPVRQRPARRPAPPRRPAEVIPPVRMDRPGQRLPPQKVTPRPNALIPQGSVQWDTGQQPDLSAIDPHIPDSDIVEAMQQGAQSEDDVRHYVLQKYGIA